MKSIHQRVKERCTLNVMIPVVYRGTPALTSDVVCSVCGPDQVVSEILPIPVWLSQTP